MKKHLKINWERDQKKKILLAAGLLICFMLLLWEGVWGAVDNPWDGETLTVPATDENGAFLITTGAELAWFADQVNNGNGEINGVLMNTIYLNNYNTSYEWPMIGADQDCPFKGTFDGNGYKVNYLYARISNENPEKRYAGLFGVIDGGTVSNVKVGGTIINGYDTMSTGEGKYDQTYMGSGGIVGYLKNGQILNCVNYANTTMEGECLYRNAGGVVGINEALVLRCTNRGSVVTDVAIAQRSIGGIAGMVRGNNGQLWYCENRGSVKGYFDVGGVAGSVKNGGEIQSCCNYGSVQGNSTLGGIAGIVVGNGTDYSGNRKECCIQNVYNLGEMSGEGNVIGGIVGQMGYESWKEEELPPLPVLENAYTTVQLEKDSYTGRGAIIGYFQTGKLGNVFGLAESNLDPCAIQEKENTEYIGSVMMKSEEELKVAAGTLGDAFVSTTRYDYDNAGYPKLVWQNQTSTLGEKVDESILTLKSWLSEQNKAKYGTAYSSIETAVDKYVGLLGTVTTEEQLTAVMEEALKTLEAIRPGSVVDNELIEAIDDGIITLEEYLDTLQSQHKDLTEEQLAQLQVILEDYIQQLEVAKDLDSVAILVRDGKDALDGCVAAYEEEKRLEEIRINSMKSLTEYEADEDHGEPWMTQIQEIREKGLQSLEEAESAADVTKILEQAKADIDQVIAQIPSENAWDGVTTKEPDTDENGVYLITSGAELAWFAQTVNQGNGGEYICGKLCNDIHLGNYEWTPIGAKTVYQGAFDGNGYTVKGLKITQADTYAGLFGVVYGTDMQSIVNLTVSGTIQCDYTVDYAGGIVGYIYGKNATNRNAIVNCHNQVAVTLSHVTYQGSGVGGIAGYARNTWIRDCSNSGTVQIASEGKGGIQYYAGGILGSSGETVSVRRSYNKGTVSAYYCAGGIVGKVIGVNNEYTSNYNAGEVYASIYAGGLAGQIPASADGSAVSWSYNSGTINLNKNGEYIGALFGGIQAGTFQNLYALKQSNQTGLALVGYSSASTAPGTFLSDTELRTDDTLNSLNGGGNYFIRDYMGIQSGFPILNWQLSLEDFRTGAITDLETFVSQEDYTEENWSKVEQLRQSGIEAIRAASNMEELQQAFTDTRLQILAVETKEAAAMQKLQEAKEAAISTLENYADASLYREEEQMKLTIYLSDAVKLIGQASTLEEVERHLSETKENIDNLPTAAQYQYEQDVKAAAQVEAYISNIGEVILNDYVKTSIHIARTGYDQLTEAQKSLVSNYQVLVDAELLYQQLSGEYEGTEEDAALAALVDQQILEIGAVTLDSQKTIQSARLAYDGLTEYQKTLVTQYPVLTEAENTYDQLRASQVTVAIASIGTVTLEKGDAIASAQSMYDELTDRQKTLVTDYEVLVNARKTYENLKSAQVVMDMIAQIGTVTLEKESTVVSAIQAYNALTGDQQALVSNYYLLEQAAAQIDSMKAVRQVEQMIENIGTVSQASGNYLKQVRAAYDGLTKEEQSQVSNVSILENAEAAYQALTKQNEKNPASVGSVADFYKNAGKGNSTNSSSGAENSLSQTGTEGETDAETMQDGLETGDFLVSTETSGDSSENLENGFKSNGESTEGVVMADVETTEKRRIIFILACILAGVLAVTGMTGFLLTMASRKRKEKQVRY